MKTAVAAVATLCTILRADSNKVRPDLYLDNIKFLSSEKLRGRGTGTPELDQAARYIEGKFKSFGLATATQSFAVTTRARLAAGGNRLQYSINGEKTILKSSREFVPLNFSGNGKVSGHVVFAGYGITAPEFGYDDYGGIDARDKIVLMLRGEPQEFEDNSRFEGKAYTAHSQFGNKAANAKSHGAKAVIFLNALFDRGNGRGTDRLELFVRTTGPGNSGIPFVHMLAGETDKWFAAAGKDLTSLGQAIDRDFVPQSFAFPPQLDVELNVEIERHSREVRNVSAYLPGETNEYIVIGAHYDHLGQGEQFSLGTPGVTHPGADDNASGVSGVIELARYFSHQPKWKRGILFLTFAGEELGLLGSAHYVRNPARPLSDAVAMLNMDMIGRLRDGKLFLAGAKTAPGLKKLVDDAAAHHPGLQIDTSETAGYGSSDHTSFASKQIPVLFFFSGLHGDYHKPSDTWDRIDAKGAVQVLDLVVDIAGRLTSGATLSPHPNW